MSMRWPIVSVCKIFGGKERSLSLGHIAIGRAGLPQCFLRKSPRCMMLGRFLLAAVAVGVAGLDARAADLTAIKRVIGKEPVYQGRPRYCLLVFGPEAKTRIWMVRDDRNLYMDRDSTGDLAAAGAKVAGDPNRYMNIPDIGAPGHRKSCHVGTLAQRTCGQVSDSRSAPAAAGVDERAGKAAAVRRGICTRSR
jgi:hypothetical protein